MRRLAAQAMGVAMVEQSPSRPALTFGPVPSRRLGRSLGINNIPPKTCTYSCVYCQLGRTPRLQLARQSFYSPEDITQAVQNRVQQAQTAGEVIDYLTFVPDGEPTLDLNLGRTIQMLKPLGIPIAVITNSSLIDSLEVQDDLSAADWVSLKLDAFHQAIWQRIDRPHGRLRLSEILQGALAFARYYAGSLATETMLVAGVNDEEEHLASIAEFLNLLRPDVAYLSIPTRPPAEGWVKAPNEYTLVRAYQVFSAHVGHVEWLIGYEGDAFAATGDIVSDLLSITAVHPMRQEAVVSLLRRNGAGWDVVEEMIRNGHLKELEYGGRKYYLRTAH